VDNVAVKDNKSLAQATPKTFFEAMRELAALDQSAAQKLIDNAATGKVQNLDAVTFKALSEKLPDLAKQMLYSAVKQGQLESVKWVITQLKSQKASGDTHFEDLAITFIGYERPCDVFHSIDFAKNYAPNASLELLIPYLVVETDYLHNYSSKAKAQEEMGRVFRLAQKLADKDNPSSIELTDHIFYHLVKACRHYGNEEFLKQMINASEGRQKYFIAWEASEIISQFKNSSFCKFVTELAPKYHENEVHERRNAICTEMKNHLVNGENEEVYRKCVDQESTCKGYKLSISSENVLGAVRAAVFLLESKESSQVAVNAATAYLEQILELRDAMAPIEDPKSQLRAAFVLAENALIGKCLKE